jgi:hypothetical protein
MLKEEAKTCINCKSFRCKKRRLNLHKLQSFKCKKRRLNLHDGKCMPRLPQPVATHEWGGEIEDSKKEEQKSVLKKWLLQLE